eukprot:3937523-Rhodomonas_salina.1
MDNKRVQSAWGTRIILDDSHGDHAGILTRKVPADHQWPGVEDDIDDPVFQYIVVAQAIKHGTQQSLPEQSYPLLNAEQCCRNYHYIVQTIAGFSVQISAKCYTAFPHDFSKQDAMAVLHPLAGLREFADIHSQYQHNSTSINSSSAWKANFE